MKGVARPVGAVLCLAAAAFLVLLALDVRAWSSRFPADDLRYRRDASAARLWRVHPLAGSVAQHLLGASDDLEYRRALRDFRLGRPTEPINRPAITSHRIAAQVELAEVADSAADPARRSQVDNLLGVLAYALGAQDVAARKAFLNNAITAFQDATVLDPSNDDAFYNLEYALDQIRGSGEQQAPGSSEFGHRGHAGLKPPGQGY